MRIAAAPGVLLAVVVCALGCVTGPLPPPDGPNVLLVVVDEWRADSFGGRNPLALTPQIDDVAAEGATFRNAFVVQSLCSPSRASLLTGVYPHIHGVDDNETALSRDLPNLPGLLHAQGYRTGFVGKWHMGNRDEPRPEFDHWVSFKGQGSYIDPELNANGHRQRWKGHITDLLTDAAVRFIREPRERPFFLMVSHLAAHQPFIPQPRYRGSLSGIPIPMPSSFHEDRSDKPRFVERAAWRDSTWTAGVIRAYFETLRGADESVGTLIRVLREESILDSTVVILVGDNGLLLGEHGIVRDKRVGYEESIRVPLIVRYPPWFAPGVQPGGLATMLDIAPTVLEAARVAVPADMQGLSLVSLARDSTIRDSFLYEYTWYRVWPNIPTIRGVRTTRYKYLTYPLSTEIDELYDLEVDPFELDNLAALPSQVGLRDSLASVLSALRQSVGDR